MNLADLMKAEFIGIRKLKTHLSELLAKNKPLIVTERGKPMHFVIPYEEMLGIVEILEEASSPKIVAEVEKARYSYKQGRSIPLKVSELRKKLGY